MLHAPGEDTLHTRASPSKDEGPHASPKCWQDTAKKVPGAEVPVTVRSWKVAMPEALVGPARKFSRVTVSASVPGNESRSF